MIHAPALCMGEASAVLVSVPVFKTGETSLAGLVGSIPIRFRFVSAAVRRRVSVKS